MKKSEESKEKKVLTWENYCEEIRPYWLMVTKGYGFSLNDIDQSCPSDLEPYEKAYKKNLEMGDAFQHMWWGKYGISALIFAIEHCFAKSPRSEYEKESILSKVQADGEITEERKQRELDAFIQQNERMRSNWKRKQKKEE